MPIPHHPNPRSSSRYPLWEWGTSQLSSSPSNSPPSGELPRDASNPWPRTGYLPIARSAMAQISLRPVRVVSLPSAPRIAFSEGATARPPIVPAMMVIMRTGIARRGALRKKVRLGSRSKDDGRQRQDRSGRVRSKQKPDCASANQQSRPIPSRSPIVGDREEHK